MYNLSVFHCLFHSGDLGRQKLLDVCPKSTNVFISGVFCDPVLPTAFPKPSRLPN